MDLVGREERQIQWTALVLSPRASMISSTRPSSSHSFNDNQIVMHIPRNSRALLALSTPHIGDEGCIFNRQARPLCVNPPSPSGQESEKPSRVGFRIVKPLSEIPSCALSRKCFHNSKSAICSLFRRKRLRLAR